MDIDKVEQVSRQRGRLKQWKTSSIDALAVKSIHEGTP